MKIYKPYTRKQYADLASFCNRNGMIIEDKGDYLESVLPPIHIPTNEEQRQARADAYLQEIDPLHSQKQRRTILGTWTEEDEAEYVEKIKTLSEDINNRFPYMENEEQTENEELTNV